MIIDYLDKCIVIDDNYAAIDLLSHYLALNESTTLVKSFNNPIAALSFLSKWQIDLIFLDIEMLLI
jgi:two-component system, LytTR family, response regulator